MTLFPFFLDLTGKQILIIGGGSVAAGKVKHLLPFTTDITILAPENSIPLQGKMKLIERKYRFGDIALGDIIIGATSDRAVNQQIAAEASEAGKPVNIVDDPALCSFIFPSLVKRGDLTVGISTNGKSPVAAQYVRRQVEKAIPDAMEDIIDKMGELRKRIPKLISDGKVRAKLYRELFEIMAEENRVLSEEEIQKMINDYTEAFVSDS